MTRPAARIGAIYRKELVDILRDRRTLMAMIVIPVVLYPVLMLGFVRAAETEQERLRAQNFTVEVQDEDAATALREIVRAGQDLPEDPGPGPTLHAAREEPTFDIRVGQTPVSQLGNGVHLRVALKLSPSTAPFPPRVAVEITYTELNVHSRTAMQELTHVIDRYRQLQTRAALADLLGGFVDSTPVEGQVDLLLNPVEIRTISTATEKQRGGWALGQVIPLILVLMTITGAIYPAIDLTAGERERGTLETLMAAPVPVLYLIVGKFLVVATVAMITAVLNLGSVGATMHFGGLTQVITTHMPVKFPLHVLPIILVCMVPFALLFSAVLVAVCSFARTFKEAQNYVMPVIIAAMIPAFGVLLPSVELKGVMTVVPVGNMVLLTRELFQQTHTWGQVAAVLVSTTLYAAAAVAVAARLFGQEVVLFADAGSYRTLLQRRYFRPELIPTTPQALLLAALLFPLTIHTQSLIAGTSSDHFMRIMAWLAVVQFGGLFVLLPLAVTIYFRIDVRETFRLRWPPLRAWAAAVCIGLSSWALAHEFFGLQSKVLPPSRLLQEFNRQIESQLADSPLWMILLLLAIVPALTEEFLFRGFVLSGLSRNLRKWTAIALCGAIFGVYHVLIERIPVTALMGVTLAYLCWQGRSILPAMLAHAMHNGSLMIIGSVPGLPERLGLAGTDAGALLPARVLIPALALFTLGLVLAASLGRLDRSRADDRRATCPQAMQTLQ